MTWKKYIKEAIAISRKPTQAVPSMQVKDIDGFQEAVVKKDLPNVEIMGLKSNKKSKITLKKGMVLYNGSDGILIKEPKQKEKTIVIASPKNVKALVPVLTKLK